MCDDWLEPIGNYSALAEILNNWLGNPFKNQKVYINIA